MPDDQFCFPLDLIATLKTANHIAVLTGAGISAESGVPTFREAQTGLWARYRPEELANPRAFHRNPHLVWEWYTWRRELVAKAEPNPGHAALAEMEQRASNFTLITQNVDGLHQRSGSGTRFPLIELHGNIQRSKCLSENLVIETLSEDGEIPPRCPRCGSLLRPDVVWFGEPIPSLEIQAAIKAAQSCDVFFSIGTSAIVEPAASLPHLAIRGGACLIEINPNQTPLTPHASYVFSSSSGDVLPSLINAVWPG